MAIALLALRYLWPFVLVGGLWWWADDGWCNKACAKQKIAAEVNDEMRKDAEDKLAVARKRATDLALLYASTLPAIDKAARDQKGKDDEQMASLEARIARLSHAPTCVLSPSAVGVLRDIAAAANNGNATAATGSAERATAVDASPASYSEAEITEHERVNAQAYQACVRMFHETRDLYNKARDAQIKASQ